MTAATKSKESTRQGQSQEGRGGDNRGASAKPIAISGSFIPHRPALAEMLGINATAEMLVERLEF